MSQAATHAVASRISTARLGRKTRRAAMVVAALSGTSLLAYAVVANWALVAALHEPAADEHGDQSVMIGTLDAGHPDDAFMMAFHRGDELFETHFNALDGVGANVGRGQRFTHVPRADLNGPGEWRNHVPQRATGPNADSCNACHRQVGDDGAGGPETNVHRDPTMSGSVGSFIERNTPHLFGAGALQRLAEEMTQILQHQRDDAVSSCCSNGHPVTVALVAKGVSFGTLVVTHTGSQPCTTNVDTSAVVGVAADLVVRPFQWKGSVKFVRDFNRDAAHNEIGMQAVELVGNGVDGDGDGVVDELTVGDMTAMAVYVAAQPRPTTKIELDELHLLQPPLTTAEARKIRRGKQAFVAVGCAVCHVPNLKIDDPIFSEPSQDANFRDAVFPGGQIPVAMGVDPLHAIRFDLTHDQPENHILDGNGVLVKNLGAFEVDDHGRAIVNLYGDLRRHEMGPDLAESIDEVGTGASTFLTKNLWGAGSTAPYLHDGRATTLTEAILFHGGEADVSKNAFVALPLNTQKEIIAFLENLVLYKAPD